MPIQVTVELTEQLPNLSIYDHIGGNRQLFPNEKGELGPFLVATTGSSPPIGRLLFRYGDKNATERLFNVKQGWNLLPPPDNFDAFAKFVVGRGQAPEKE